VIRVPSQPVHPSNAQSAPSHPPVFAQVDAGRSTFIGAADGAATQIGPHQIRPWAQQVEAKVPRPISPWTHRNQTGHRRPGPRDNRQERQFPARSSRNQRLRAPALHEQTATCGHSAARCQRQQVLINGRGGGSGIYAVQLARQQGPRGVLDRIPPAAGLTLTGCLMCLPGHSSPGTRAPPQPVAADRPGSRRPGPGQPQADESAHRVPEMLASG
jgi:hypothetical protein